MRRGCARHFFLFLLETPGGESFRETRNVLGEGRTLFEIGLLGSGRLSRLAADGITTMVQ